jgi:hyperpolarization activated cyclic nucleotide-gated potassium channel 2
MTDIFGKPIVIEAESLYKRPISQIIKIIEAIPEFVPTSEFDDPETSYVFSHFSVFRRCWEYLIFCVTLLIPIEISFVLFFDQNINFSNYCFFFLIDIVIILHNFVILKTPILKYGIFNRLQSDSL